MTNIRILYYDLLYYIEADKIDHLSDGERLNLIQSIAESGPSTEGWNALIELFYAWKWNHKHEAIAYANSLIVNWPLAIRTVNAAWGRIFDNKKLTDVVWLAKGIEINRSSDGNELAVIASSPNAVNLVQISMDRSRVSFESVSELAHSKFLNVLISLDLNGIIFTDEKLGILFNTTALSGLEFLKLKKCTINTERTKLFAGSKLLTQLLGLNLSHNTISNKGIDILFNSTLLPNLEELNLTNNFISDEGAVLLLKSAFLPNLREVILNENNFKNTEALYALAEKKNNLKLIL